MEIGVLCTRSKTVSFAQRSDYFQCLKLADWQLIITHIQSFIKGWAETKHLRGSGNDPRLVIIPQLKWVMCALRLWCYCARALALAAAGRVFPGEASNTASIVSSTAEERVADSPRERSFVPQLRRKTQRQTWEKATRRQYRQLLCLHGDGSLKSCIGSSTLIWLQRGIFTHSAHPWIHMKL